LIFPEKRCRLHIEFNFRYRHGFLLEKMIGEINPGEEVPDWVKHEG